MEPIPLTRPYLFEEEAAAAAAVVRSGWLTTGPKVAEFENALAQAVGAADAVAVSNGTTAIELALRVVGVRPGDVVLTVSHSFIATANAIRSCGAEPIFIDVDETRNMSVDALAQTLDGAFDDGCYTRVAEIATGSSPLATVAKPSGRLGAILVVHQVGMPADLGAITRLAAAANVPIVEDAACALGSQIRLGDEFEAVGAPRGDVASFSFHPRKVLTTGEGGALTFSSASLAAEARLLRNHGLEITGDGERRYTRAGFNYRMSDVAAAIGCVQLSRLEEIVSRRRELAAEYGRALSSVENVAPPHEPAWARSNFQSYVVTLADRLDQRAVLASLGKSGIAAQPGIMCAHLEPAYSEGACKLPVSEQAFRHGLTLPLFPQMSVADVRRVVDALAQAL